jgi:hypothetical protein
MLNCHQVTHLCSEEQERDLTLGEELGVGMHTMMCKGCKNYRKQMKFLRLAAKRYSEGAALAEIDAPDENDPR